MAWEARSRVPRAAVTPTEAEFSVGIEHCPQSAGGSGLLQPASTHSSLSREQHPCAFRGTTLPCCEQSRWERKSKGQVHEVGVNPTSDRCPWTLEGHGGSTRPELAKPRALRGDAKRPPQGLLVCSFVRAFSFPDVWGKSNTRDPVLNFSLASVLLFMLATTRSLCSDGHGDG